jgi:PadR family transcriptional regulator PadR
VSLPRLNETDILILSTILGSEHYGLEIIEEVKRISDGKRKISLGGLYTTLHRMEQKGLVEGRWGDTTAERQGARRRYYKVTGLGARALRESATVMRAAFRFAALPVRG